jgi:hypothetical protein
MPSEKILDTNIITNTLLEGRNSNATNVATANVNAVSKKSYSYAYLAIISGQLTVPQGSLVDIHNIRGTVTITQTPRK